MIERLYSIAISYSGAPPEVRAALAAARDDLPGVLRRGRAWSDEAAVLSTCCRFELYGVIRGSRAGNAAVQLERLAGIPVDPLEPYVRIRVGHTAVMHLLRVAAGLESPILGEDAVLGQVRRAFQLASEAGAAGPVLSALFRAAIHVGKRARHETGIGRYARSYAQLVVNQLSLGVGAPRSILIVGAGGLAQEILSHLKRVGVSAITVASRHVQRAALLADQVGGDACGLEDLPRRLRDADMVIACASTPRTIVVPSMLRKRERPLSIVDLGVPCNVDPDVAGIPGVRLTCLDELLTDGAERPAVVYRAERMIYEEHERFLRWLKVRCAPSIARLRASGLRETRRVRRDQRLQGRRLEEVALA